MRPPMRPPMRAPHAQGERVILVREETSPEDVGGLHAAEVRGTPPEIPAPSVPPLCNHPLTELARACAHGRARRRC